MGYDITNVTLCTGMTNNPVDGSIYIDENTYEVFLYTGKKKWAKLEKFDEKEFERLKLIENRKEKLIKLNGK